MTRDNLALGAIRHTVLSGLGLLTAACLLTGMAGCHRQQDAAAGGPLGHSPKPPDPPSLPASELVIAEPVQPSAILDGNDVRTSDPTGLHGMAYRYASERANEKAAQCQYWVVRATDEGRYDLACWESLAGKVEAAMYWLQEAGRREGVSTKWAQIDPDLENVREDSRWPKLLIFLRECEGYWRVAGPKQNTLIVPEGYDGRAELTLVVWLHGMGGNPGDRDSEFQSLANSHQIAFVGVSGTIPTGKTKFAWADVAEEDYERVRLTLAEARGRICWREGTAVALGFSQGAMVGLEVAVRHPEVFAGAITVSAGTGSPVQLDAVLDKAALHRQGFVIVCGAKEDRWRVERSEELVRWLETATGNVLKPAYPNHATHAFPADFAERFPEWLVFIDRVHAAKSP